MKGRLTIIFDEELDEFDDKIDISESYDEDNMYTICCRTSYDEDFLSFISNKEHINNMLTSALCYAHLAGEDAYKIYEIAKVKVWNKSLFLDCQKIYFHGDYEKIKIYLDKNPILHDKEIIICDIEDLNYDLYFKLKNMFSEYHNIKFQVNGNNDCITIDEYGKTILGIEEIVSKVKRNNFSPFESMIYAYDLVRNRFYHKENDGEKSTISRDLSAVLLGDKIVCLGFARIYNTVLEQLNIPSMIFILNDKDSPERHARILSFIKDEKYQIEGLYFSDPTFDCKKDENNTFLKSYRYFAKTKKQIDHLSPYHFDYDKYNFLEDKEIDVIESSCPNGNISYYDFISIIPFTRINRILDLTGEPRINITNIYTKDEIIDILYNIQNFLSSPISARTFFEAVYNVRKIQYYEEPTKYPFDYPTLAEILYRSKFIASDSSEEYFVNVIIGGNVSMSLETAYSKARTYLNEKQQTIEIQRIILTRLLKTIAANKESSENVNQEVLIKQ